MTAKSSFPTHFKWVMAHGGDPNLVNPVTKETVLITVITQGTPYTKERIQLLIEAGVDLNQPGATGTPPAVKAVSMFGQYDIALFLLESGVDPNIYIENQNKKLAHMVAIDRKDLSTRTPEQKADFVRLVQWLEDHGQSIAEADADFERWKKSPHSRTEQARLRKQR